MLVRALIVLFTVLNLGVAAWWIAHDPPPPPAAAAPPAGVARLQLIGEGASARPAPTSLAAVAGTPSPGAAPDTAGALEPPTQQCFTFGPFASRQASAAALATLKPMAQKVTTREQAAVAATTRGWRVYLPPLPSLEQAQAVAQRIGAAGFDDFLVVREGVEANSVALGRYRSEESARKRADALIAAGFAVQAAPLGEADAAATWLDVVAGQGFDPGRAQAAIAAAQYRRADCPPR